MQTREKTAELVARIKEQGDQFAQTDGAYLMYLKGMKRFHRYSFSNQMLIFIQRPDATAVNSYKRWQALGQQVRKGEKGISIIAPRIAKSKVPGEDDFMYFAGVSVFAFEQTDPIEGFENPWMPMEIPRLTGDGGREHIDKLVETITADGITVEWFDTDSNYNGYFEPGAEKIAVSSALSNVHQLSTLVHEMAHWQHWKLDKAAFMGLDSRVVEFVAESTSYAVLDALGIDASAKSVSYIGFYNLVNRDEKLVSHIMKQVVDITHTILDMLESEPTEVEEGVAA